MVELGKGRGDQRVGVLHALPAGFLAAHRFLEEGTVAVALDVGAVDVPVVAAAVVAGVVRAGVIVLVDFPRPVILGWVLAVVE